VVDFEVNHFYTIYISTIDLDQFFSQNKWFSVLFSPQYQVRQVCKIKSNQELGVFTENGENF